MSDFMIREFFKMLRREGVTVKLLKADNGNYGIKFVDLNNKLSNIVYDYFYKYKNNEL